MRSSLKLIMDELIRYPPYKKHLVTKTKEHEKEDEKIFSSYDKIIATLPSKDGWTSSFPLCQHQGFWFTKWHCPAILAAQDHFKARQSDILFASNPKSGTTWLKALIFSIVNRSSFPTTHQHPLLTNNPHELVLDLEFHLHGNRRIRELDTGFSPRLLATHIPYTALPQSVEQSGCQIVYICRNPKDTFISAWHYMNKFRTRDSKPPIKLEVAFELFMNGSIAFGLYWDHVMGYWKESTRRPERVLVLKYEQMQAETFGEVVKLAKFIGYPFSEDEVRNGVVESILKLCSFEEMTKLEVNKTGLTSFGIEYNTYFRKGKVGDWENYLTEEMIKRIDEMTELMFQGSGLKF